MARDAGVEAWLTLPRRLYLDTGTLQTMYDYGETLWENEPFEPLRRDCKVPGLADESDALRNIFLVNERAHFEFAVTEASLGRSRPATSRATRSGSTTFSTAGWCRRRARSRFLRRPSIIPASATSAWRTASCFRMRSTWVATPS